MRVVEHPELVNTDAHGDGWLLRVRLADEKQLAALMSSAEYDEFIAREATDEAMARAYARWAKIGEYDSFAGVIRRE